MNSVSQQLDSQGGGAPRRAPSRVQRNSPCPCGSGRRYKQCCGRVSVPAPSDADFEKAQEWYEEAKAALEEGDDAQAAALCYRILVKLPNDIDTQRLLVAVKRRTGDKASAEFLLRRLRDANPDNDEVLLDLADYQLSEGRQQRAEYNLDRALRANPDNLRGHLAKVRLCQQRGDIAHAEYHLRQALNIEPESADAYADLGRLLSLMGMKEEAVHNYRVALSLRPDHVPTLLGWAETEESRGKLKDSVRLLKRVRALDPETPGLPLAEAVVLYRAGKFTEALERLKYVERNQLSVPAQVSYYFYRGHILDRLKRYTAAFDMYRRANALCSHALRLTYRAAQAQENADRLRRFFTADRLARLPRAEPRPGEPRPIFIVGFPRSGATIIEQMLSLHPQISAGDELFLIPNLASAAARIAENGELYPECLAAAADNAEIVQRLRDEYFAMLQVTGALEPGAACFTDKLPLNEWHLGLIQLLFPEARIIHVLRHPFDVVLSTFFNDIRHGELCSYNLETAARHYALTMELMEHYRPLLKLDILTVRYENLVMDVEKMARELLAFAGVEWDPACIEFHKNPRLPRSPSAADVRRPLYRDAVFRYRHYREEIQSVAGILKPLAEKLKYEVV